MLFKTLSFHITPCQRTQGSPWKIKILMRKLMFEQTLSAREMPSYTYRIIYNLPGKPPPPPETASMEVTERVTMTVLGMVVPTSGHTLPPLTVSRRRGGGGPRLVLTVRTRTVV